MKKFLLITLAGMLYSTFSLQAEDLEPYSSINLLPHEPYYLPNSWLVLDKLLVIGGTTFIDVGSQNGSAARYIAHNTDETVRVYSVDLWFSLAGFQKFLSNVWQEGTAAKIVPIRMKSEEAAFGLNVAADVIYIDTSIPSKIEDNILSWFSHLSENGIICGDNWHIPSVEIQIVQAASDLGLNVGTDGTFWYIQKVI